MTDIVQAITEQAPKILEELSLPSIKIEFKLYGNNSSYQRYNNIITLGLLNRKKRFFEYTYPYLKFKPDICSEEDIILWSFFHELGHHLQHSNFPVWLDRYAIYNYHCECLSREEEYQKYREVKAEANADKIACILFNRYKNLIEKEI